MRDLQCTVFSMNLHVCICAGVQCEKKSIPFRMALKLCTDPLFILLGEEIVMLELIGTAP